MESTGKVKMEFSQFSKFPIVTRFHFRVPEELNGGNQNS